MKNYLVIEIQQMPDGEIANIATAYEDRDEAASKFHAILSVAATSTLPCHAATWLNADGSLVDWKCFRHAQPATTE